MKIIKENKPKLTQYKVEYWYLSFCGDDDMGYDFDVVQVGAISPRQAILKAKQSAPRNAKKFQVIK
tara:strand:+ start:527 stop:724 length:198 start_codon:yes stop_codon:yes gene_type:complete